SLPSHNTSGRRNLCSFESIVSVHNSEAATTPATRIVSVPNQTGCETQLGIQLFVEKTRPKLLFVDDDKSIRQTLPRILAKEGFDCTIAASVPEALSQISRQRFDILLSDLNVGEPGDGFIVVGAMRRVQPHARTYILTGYPDFASAL